MANTIFFNDFFLIIILSLVYNNVLHFIDVFFSLIIVLGIFLTHR